jgi:glycosyltransferase involved in cell wall biosynthesis
LIASGSDHLVPTTTPKITIGLPTFNGARFLGETLESLLAQDAEDFEILISDNGSTDDTERICRSFSRSSKVRYMRCPINKGAAWNYNNVLRAAQGRYFKWAADDDVCMPTFLSSCVDHLDNNDRAILSWPQTLLIDERGNAIRPLEDSNLELKSSDPVARLTRVLQNREEWHPVFGVIRTDVLRRTAGIGTFVYADVALLAELALIGEFHQLRETLFLRRYHQDRSLMANPSFQAHAAWYKPERPAGRAVLPNATLVRQLLRRARSPSLSFSERNRASVAILRHWALPHWRHIGGEYKRALPVIGRHWE